VIVAGGFRKCTRIDRGLYLLIDVQFDENILHFQNFTRMPSEYSDILRFIQNAICYLSPFF
jgi:hypothetical protein